MSDKKISLRVVRSASEAVEPASAQSPVRAKSAEKSIPDRIEDLRNDMFGAMAMIAVARDSVDWEDNYDLNRVLDDAYKAFYRIAEELNEVSCDAKEVAHAKN